MYEKYYKIIILFEKAKFFPIFLSIFFSFFVETQFSSTRHRVAALVRLLRYDSQLPGTGDNSYVRFTMAERLANIFGTEKDK